MYPTMHLFCPLFNCTRHILLFEINPGINLTVEHFIIKANGGVSLKLIGIKMLYPKLSHGDDDL